MCSFTSSLLSDIYNSDKHLDEIVKATFFFAKGCTMGPKSHYVTFEFYISYVIKSLTLEVTPSATHDSFKRS